jgi:hypothetical protein
MLNQLNYALLNFPPDLLKSGSKNRVAIALDATLPLLSQEGTPQKFSGSVT